MNFKIPELQGLRCLAIISVLLYHFYPKIFANGFLGVDVFFVISGYIMALILLSSDHLKTSFLSTTLNFYYRRIYRILPLYLINILVTIILIPAISYTSVVNFDQLKSVLTLTKNFKDFFRKNFYFFNEFHDSDWFLHYWSLCVELQFYLIVPFLFYICKRIKLEYNLFILWPTLICCCIFLIFYLLINFGNVGALFTFNFLPARFYEFCGGFIAFHFQCFIDEKSKNCKFMLKFKEYFQNYILTNILTFGLLIILLWPKRLIDLYSLPATVILTSVTIIAIGKSEKTAFQIEYSMLANNIAVFIGNASYSIYIFHWMFIIISRIKMIESQKTHILILAISFIYGIFAHKFIEKPIIKAKLQPKYFLIYVIFAWILILWAGYYNSIGKENFKDFTNEIYYNKSRLIINPTEWNKIAAKIDPEISAELALLSIKKACFGHRNNYFETLKANPKYPPSINDTDIWSGNVSGNGNLSILVIGNSFAECSIPAIEMSLNGQYSIINYVANAAGIPFEGFKFSRSWFIFKDVVKHFKADIIFVIFAQYGFDEEPTIEPIENDKQTQKVQEMINFLSENSKAIFISKNTFQNENFEGKNFAEQMYDFGWSKKYMVKQKDIENIQSVSARRWKVIKCKNCIYLNMLETFCNNGWCSPIDETGKVPLIRDNGHLTVFGAYKLSMTIKKEVKRMYKFIEEN